MIARRGVAGYVELGFVALVILLSVGVLVDAAGWPIQARLFPTVVALPLLALGVLQFGIALRAPGATAASGADEIGLWHASARVQALRLAFWVAVFVACLELFSFPIGLPLAIFLYLRFESREGWIRCLILAGITFGYIALVFDRGLHLPWPEGLLTQLI